MISIDPVMLAKAPFTSFSMAMFIFHLSFIFCRLDAAEKKRMAVIAVLFIASAIFWAGYEQAGSTLNLFAERYTNRFIAFTNYEVPASWFQSFGGGFVIILAPVIAAVFGCFWRRRQINPSIPMKFGLGLLFLGAGFRGYDRRGKANSRRAKKFCLPGLSPPIFCTT